MFPNMQDVGQAMKLKPRTLGYDPTQHMVENLKASNKRVPFKVGGMKESRVKYLCDSVPPAADLLDEFAQKNDENFGSSTHDNFKAEGWL